MAKKKPVTRQIKPKSEFHIEQQRWFVPAYFAVILVALLFLFRDFVFSDKMLAMSDQIQAGVFFRMFLVEHFLNSGSFPQWMPYIFGGMPYIEAFHGDIFYPLSMMKLLATDYTDYVRIQGWTLIWHIYLAGVFMYFCAKSFNLSKVASLVSATIYMFAPLLVSMIAPGHDGKIYVITLFPLVIMFLELGFTRSNKLLYFSLLGMVIGVIILSPHAQMSYYTLWAVSFYALLKLVNLFREKKSIKPLIKPGALTAYAVVIGLTLSAIQFYPGYNYTTNYSPRTDTKQGWEWSTSWSLHEEEAFSLVVNEFSGTRSNNTKTYYWGKNAFKDNSESVTVIGIFLGLIGFFFSRRREGYFFGGLALFSLIYALAATTPIYYIFFYLIPKVSALRAASMIMFMFLFSTALLSGFAIQTIKDKREQLFSDSHKRFKYLLFGFPSFMFLLAFLFTVAGKGMLNLWASIFHSTASTTLVQQGVTKLDIGYMNLPAIVSGAWMGFIFTAIVAGCIYLYTNKKSGMLILAVIPLVVVWDGLRFDSRFIDTIEPQQYFAGNPVTDYFKNIDGKYRVMNMGIIPEDMLPFFGVDVVVGYHGNQLNWYDKLLGGPQKKNRRNPRFLNLVGAKYLLLQTNDGFNPGYFGDKPVQQIVDFGPAKVLKNDNAIDRVFLADSVIVMSDIDKLVDQVINGYEDLSHVVYLEKTPTLQIKPDSMLSDSAWIIEYANDSIVIGTNCQSNRMLVLTDNYYYAWQVFVDGEKSELLRADGSFRAVELPAGTKQVKFKYKSSKYGTGKMLTGLTMVWLFVILVFYSYRGFSRKEEKETQIE